jgi:hypothetical protein
MIKIIRKELPNSKKEYRDVACGEFFAFEEDDEELYIKINSQEMDSCIRLCDKRVSWFTPSCKVKLVDVEISYSLQKKEQ